MAVNRIRYVVLALLLTGCPEGAKVIEEKLPEQLPEKLPPLALPLPRTADGKFILIEVGKSGIDLDPTLKDPLTALGGCTDLITKAYVPTQSLDDAVSAVKSCVNATPWQTLSPCCPTGCKDRYTQLRGSGAGEFAAFDQVFFKDPACFPGVNDLVGGAP